MALEGIKQGIFIQIPMRPVPWARVRVYGKKFFNTTETMVAKKTIATYMRAAMRSQKPFEMPISVETEFCYLKVPTKLPHLKDYPAKRPDADNLLKIVLDSGNGILWKDDAFICELFARKSYADKEQILITVREI